MGDHPASSATLALLGALAAHVAPAGFGCVKYPYHVETCDKPDPTGCVIERVDIRGARGVDSAKIEEKIATSKTSHVLGGLVEHIPLLSLWDRLTVNYERLDPFVLQRDLSRIERYYQARGYYEAHVQAGRVRKLPEGKIQVEIVVDEGAPVRIAKVTPVWKDWDVKVNPKATAGVENVITAFKLGEIFDEDPFEQAKGSIRRALTDRGYAYAKVEGSAGIDEARHEANLVFTIELGPHCTFGAVSVEGQGDLPTVPLLAALRVRAGAEFSTSVIDSAEIALGDFGLFGSIDAEPQLSAPTEASPRTSIPVVFRVQPVQIHAVKLGFGGEVGGRVEVHGIAGWEHRNLFGGLRRFTVEASPAVAVYPKTFSTLADGKPVVLLPEFRLRTTLTQPGFLLPLDARTRGYVRGSFNVYQLDTTDVAESSVNDKIVGYLESGASLGVERPWWSSHINVNLSMNFQADVPFEYHLIHPLTLPDGYTTVLIPSVRATGSIDFRSSDAKRIDPVNPHRGVFFTNDFQFAFGTARDIRIRPELRGYVPVTSKVTLALRAAAGILVPFNYGDGIASTVGTHFTPAGCRDSQLLPFRAFFSGGSNSNRGYPYNGVGPHDVTCLATLQTAVAPSQVATGGFHLWESSVELRVPVYDKLGTVVFVDASDVTRGEFRVCAPHLSTGLGLRYDTPVGPLRADLGLRVPGAQVIGTVEACKEGVSGEGVLPTVIGLPLAVSVAIGEAF